MFFQPEGTPLGQSEGAIDPHFTNAHEDLNISAEILFNGDQVATLRLPSFAPPAASSWDLGFVNVNSGEFQERNLLAANHQAFFQQ